MPEICIVLSVFRYTHNISGFVLKLNLYCIWQAYRASMLKAFRKTLEEGIFTFVVGMGFLFLISPKKFKSHGICVLVGKIISISINIIVSMCKTSKFRFLSLVFSFCDGWICFICSDHVEAVFRLLIAFHSTTSSAARGRSFSFYLVAVNCH